MSRFAIQFDITGFQQLDQFALLACQDYNLGNAGDWFQEFRGGLYGMYSRLYGVSRHYFEVHAWLPRSWVTDAEYHLASALFHMDSALECLTFSLNALGWIAKPTEFWDVTDPKALRKIAPRDIIGDRSKSPPGNPKPGYGTVFPTLQRIWQTRAQLMAKIGDLHDISKHRQTVFVGGNLRSDPPPGFRAIVGIPDDAPDHALWKFSPMSDIILKNDPKEPAAQRRREQPKKGELLEEVMPAFAELIQESGAAAFADSQINIRLRETQLRR
jgi:hypothetical protein